MSVFDGAYRFQMDLSMKHVEDSEESPIKHVGLRSDKSVSEGSPIKIIFSWTQESEGREKDIVYDSPGLLLKQHENISLILLIYKYIYFL